MTGQDSISKAKVSKCTNIASCKKRERKHNQLLKRNTIKSHLESYAGFFRLLMKVFFDPYVL